MPMLLWGRAVAWFIADSSGPRLPRVGQKRAGTAGSLPVRGGGSPVQCCLPLVLAYVAHPCRRCSLVNACGTLVRLGRPVERVCAGGEHLRGGSKRLSRMTLSRVHPLARGGGLALNGVPASFPELLQPRADGLKPSVDLPLTAWRGPRLAVHTSQHA